LGDAPGVDTLIQCIYASVCAPGFAEPAIPRLLDVCRGNNARLGVTGMLLYIEGGFFQVLEGMAPDVDPLYERICSDRRHLRVTRIIREPIVERQFAEWSMGFSLLNREDAGVLLGENDFFAAATCLDDLDSGRARKLLNAFRDGRWRADRTGRFRRLDAKV
jgi:hypothetical protein